MGDQSNSRKRARRKPKPLTQGTSSLATNNRGKKDDDDAIPEKDIEPKVEPALSENALIESASELFKAKGYKVTRNPPTGSSMMISRRVEVSNNQFILDLIPFHFHYGGGSVRFNDEDGRRLEMAGGESDSVNESCNELAKESQRIATYLSQGFSDRGKVVITNPPNSIVEGLQTFSVRILLRRINYSKLEGRPVGFWANPVFLTSSRLEDRAGNTVPWIPFPTEAEKRGVDVVDATTVASYLDFRDREVRILGRELLSKEGCRESFPEALRLFRAVTICASIVLIGAFIILALNGASISLAALLALGLGASIEALGARRLIKGYRSLQRTSALILGGSPNITPEQILRNENEFPPDERAFLYWKYGGADLSKLRKETNQQRISDLMSKSEVILNRTQKLEDEELYSEVVLSYDRATRTAITALLLSMGMEAQVKEVEKWFPHLRGVFQDTKVEDMRYLTALRDRINKGYDASKAEAERAREIAGPLIDETLLHLRNYRMSGGSQGIPLSHMPLSSTTYTDPPTQMDRYNTRLKNSISAAYSAKDNGETKTSLNKLEQAVIVAIRMKILQLTGKSPTALSLTELLRQLAEAGADARQQRQGEEAEEWISRLKEGTIQTDDDAIEYERRCLGFIESLNVIRGSKTVGHPQIALNTIKPKPASNSQENKPPTIEEPDIEKGTPQSQEVETSFSEISKEILDPASTFKFLLGATEDRELLDIGPCGAHLLEAKKELQRSSKTRRSKQVIDLKDKHTFSESSHDDDLETTRRTPARIEASSRFSDELDSITGSFDQVDSRTENAESCVDDSDRLALDVNSAVAKVMPVENLGDFKKIVSNSGLPVVASYLSDDEPSRVIDNALRQLVRKYHGKAAFYSVDFKFRDIAIESRIKSYPTVLVFNNGKLMTEVKSVELKQLDRELSAILEPSSSVNRKEDNQRSPLSSKDNYEDEEETKRDSEIGKLWAADSA
jgi:HEPN domain-containing protein